MNEVGKEIQIAPEWKSLLEEEFSRPYFIELWENVRNEYLNKNIFPNPSQVFRAFNICTPDTVRVVILGQDPYHTPHVADGLAFSSFPENPVPPSLANIYKEIESEFGCVCPVTPDLTRWAEQGVLLLNASLTVESGKANSHADFGWQEFTDAVIRVLSEKEQHIAFLLWGNYARSKRELIDFTKHCILESPHPSPLSAHRGFFGNGHFKKANEYLSEKGREKIQWC